MYLLPKPRTGRPSNTARLGVSVTLLSAWEKPSALALVLSRHASTHRSDRPTSKSCADQMCLPEAKHWTPIPDALGALLTVHLNDEFDRIVGPRTCRKQGITCLQIPPTQWASDAVQNEYDALFGSLDSDFHEALKKGRMIEIEHAG